ACWRRRRNSWWAARVYGPDPGNVNNRSGAGVLGGGGGSVRRPGEPISRPQVDKTRWRLSVRLPGRCRPGRVSESIRSGHAGGGWTGWGWGSEGGVLVEGGRGWLV